MLTERCQSLDYTGVVLQWLRRTAARLFHWGSSGNRELRREPLAGAPRRPRLKTYSAQTGLVYQYHYLGFRAQSGAVDYVFAVSHDRKLYLPVSVRVTDELAHNFHLNPTERYAVSKLALMDLFDQAQPPLSHSAPDREQVADILVRLGRGS